VTFVELLLCWNLSELAAANFRDVIGSGPQSLCPENWETLLK